VSHDWTELSKAVSHALRHEPWLYELELDNAGWTPVDALLNALSHAPRWRGLSRGQLETMIERAPKQRHEIDGNRIRALYGHSVPSRIVKTLGTPPAMLFHGTPARSAPAIAADGLRPMQRHYVHLSVDRDTAYSVGRRKDAAVAVLVIRAREAHVHGVRFRLGNHMVWLADYIPPSFLGEDAGG
jgi:putative RNA 2'-phosphotransferase